MNEVDTPYPVVLESEHDTNSFHGRDQSDCKNIISPLKAINSSLTESQSLLGVWYSFLTKAYTVWKTLSRRRFVSPMKVQWPRTTSTNFPDTLFLSKIPVIACLTLWYLLGVILTAKMSPLSSTPKALTERLWISPACNSSCPASKILSTSAKAWETSSRSETGYQGCPHIHNASLNLLL